MELLAPAGNMEALILAVQNGADAVYFGGTLFNARKNADNFDEGALRRALDYCHVRGVKAYITLNTLLKDGEVLAAYHFALQAASWGADALIVQDIGLAHILSLHTDIPLHASTQMALHNVEGLRALSNLRFSRVVLARETPVGEMGRIAKETGLETEVFVHGALCVAFSGLCLHGSLTGGRSGNRGVCPQGCRHEGVLLKENGASTTGYPLSTKDLCLQESLSALLAAGVTSLKIEGRQKRPEYVGLVTAAYRRALDCVLAGKENPHAEKDKENLLRMFNRGGFTKGPGFSENSLFPRHPNNTGFLVGKVAVAGPHATVIACAPGALQKGDSISLRAGENLLGGGVIERIDAVPGGVSTNPIPGAHINAEVFVTADKRLLAAVRQTAGESRKRPVDFVLRQQGKSLSLTASLSGITASAEGEMPEGEGATQTEDIYAALQKTGGTPFAPGKIQVLREGNAYMPASLLNALRRGALAGLQENLALQAHGRYNGEKEIAFPAGENAKPRPASIVIESVKETEEKYPPNARFVLAPPFLCAEKLQELLEALPTVGKADIGLYIPPVLFEKDILLVRGLLARFTGRFGFLLAGGMHGFTLGGEFNLPVWADYTCNVLNSFSLYYLAQQGAIGAALSPELNAQEMGALKKCIPVETVAAGRLPVMFSVHCLLRGQKGKDCAACGNGVLKDRKGFAFPVEARRVAACLNVVFNSRVHYLLKHGQKLSEMGIGLRLYAKEGAAAAFLAGQSLPGATAGHFERGLLG